MRHNCHPTFLLREARDFYVKAKAFPLEPILPSSPSPLTSSLSRRTTEGKSRFRCLLGLVVLLGRNLAFRTTYRPWSYGLQLPGGKARGGRGFFRSSRLLCAVAADCCSGEGDLRGERSVASSVIAMSKPIKVLVTGAAGQIAYSLLYGIAKGDVFGADQPLILVLLDITPMMTVLDGVLMELQDCALPLLREVIATDKEDVAFKDLDIAILVGSMPRKEGMERKDLLKANVKIFKSQGAALDKYAKKSVKVIVVGNPANTNCLIASKSAPSIPKENFSCLTRLDHNRAKSQIAIKVGVTAKDVKNCIIWGNHSSTQYPDVNHAKVKVQGKDIGVYEAVKNDNWLKGDFITTVQQRGAAVIKARKLSSAMSAAKAICDHVRDLWFGTPEGEFVSMGVISDGNSYGVPEDLIYSFPVVIKDKTWKFVEGLPVNDFSREKMDLTAKELTDEKETAVEFLSSA